MYNKTQEDYEYLFKVVNDIPVGYKLRDWDSITRILNDYFKVSLSKKQWKVQYDSGMRRVRKYGNPAARSTYILKEDKIAKEIETIESKSLRLKKYLARPKTMEQVIKFLDVDEITALGIIYQLKIQHYSVNHDSYNDTYCIDKKVHEDPKVYNHSIGEVEDVEFLVISDTHFCQKGQQLAFVNHIYDEAVRRGIKRVYHVGDISDGYYKNRPEQIYDLFAIGADEQKDYIVTNYPRREGITTYLIIGNHDETHIRNGGFNIGKAISQERPDIQYLGIGHAKIMLTPNCRMDLLHPLDGSSYAVSYSGQKYMDALTGGDKPNILFVGHHHKVLYFPYRNIHYFEVPSMTKQSSWMKRKRIANSSGAWFVKLKVDEEGTIVSVLPEHIMQYRYLENDY